MKPFILAGLLIMTSVSASFADFIDVKASGTVAETADKLAAAVENAGATVFARVPHSKGAMSVDMELQDAELVIFGNPKLGTPALQQDIRAGLFVPLRVLVHDVDGQTMLTYEMVDAMFDGLNIAEDAAFRGAMTGALEKLTGAAAE
ncbi:MAG: DUF302 domain-containing protein [Silicimonas sp.]|nr:DUF302 domain-containing protein [Silicimonas sp.]